MFNWNSQKQKVTVKLEGCLDETQQTVLCKHGNGAVCWFCVTGTEPQTENDEKEDMFESKMFKSKLE